MSEQEYLRETDIATRYGVSRERVSQWRQQGHITPAITIPAGKKSLYIYRADQLPAERPAMPRRSDGGRRGGAIEAITSLIRLIETDAAHLSQAPAVCRSKEILVHLRETNKKRYGADLARMARRNGGES